MSDISKVGVLAWLDVSSETTIPKVGVLAWLDLPPPASISKMEVLAWLDPGSSLPARRRNACVIIN